MRPHLFSERLRLAATAAFVDMRDVDDRLRGAAELQRLFYDIQAFAKPSAFLEIGAFDARFSREIRARHPQAKVIAFEANPYNHAHWTQHGGFEALGIEYRHTAISGSDGTAEFQVQSTWYDKEAPRVKGNDSLLARTETGIGYEPVSVPARRLDTVTAAPDLAGCDFSLWIDVEGASQMIFAGADETLKRTRSILIEVEEYAYWDGQWLFSDVHAHLADRGFHAVARDFENAHQYNVVFVHDSIADHYLFHVAYIEYVARLNGKL